MTELTLTQTRIRQGVWEGVLSGAAEDAASPPALMATHLEAPLDGLTVTQIKDMPGDWAVRLPIPTEILSEGVQTVVLIDPVSDDTLASFTLVTGEPLDDDIRAEIDLLRAELDLLKKAFRRHCLETS